MMSGMSCSRDVADWEKLLLGCRALRLRPRPPNVVPFLALLWLFNEDF